MALREKPGNPALISGQTDLDQGSGRGTRAPGNRGPFAYHERVTSRSTGRSTRPARRNRAEVLADSDVCIICGHRGSDSVDHIIPIAMRPDLAEDRDNLGPAHHEPCPTCAQRCNNLKGTRPLSAVTGLVSSRDWFTESVRSGS